MVFFLSMIVRGMSSSWIYSRDSAEVLKTLLKL